VELRRALLLFAIVLGLAAIASSIARPPERDNGDGTAQVEAPAPRGSGAQSKPTVTSRPGPAGPPATITVRASAKPTSRKLAVGRAATLFVEVDGSAQIDIPDLGLTAPAEPLTPARFDLLIDRAGDYAIVLDPVADGARRSEIATLKVVPPS
jgi:hypothetical protein